MWERMPYAIIFMDCQMPEMDGFEATREIRRLESERDGRITIIALTASAMDEDRRRCLGAGMDDFLAKPLQSHKLSDTLGRWAAFNPSAGFDRIDDEQLQPAVRHHVVPRTTKS